MRERAVEAIFFDMDGTIVDTEMLWAEAMVEYLADRGISGDKDEIISIVYGHAWSAIYEKIVALYPRTSVVSVNEMAVELRDYYIKLRNERDISIPESVECLRRLSAHYPIAIVSGSTRIDIGDTIKLMGLESNVLFYLGSEDYQYGKPHPMCYEMAAERLGADPERCIVIEDSRAGIRSAKAAGMRCVALVLEGALQQEIDGADLVLSSLADFGYEEAERVVKNGA
jgi:HAD superfamily hydrolase (TIGR01509 family)